MLLNYKFSNFKAFYNEVKFTMKANNYIKVINENLITKSNNNKVLKSALIFGPNNTGKTSFFESLFFMRDIVIDFDNVSKYPIRLLKNIIHNPLGDEKPICLEVEFYPVGSTEIYKFGFEIKNDYKFINEYLYKDKKCIYKRQNGKIIEGSIKRNFFNDLFNDMDTLLLHKLVGLSENALENKYIYTNVLKFFNRIVAFKNVDKDYENIYSHLSSGTNNYIKKIALGSDFGLTDIKIKEDHNGANTNDSGNLRSELDDKIWAIKTFHKTSNGVLQTPFVMFESLGTKKMISLAAFIQNAIDNDLIMIVDEIGNSLHTKLSKMLLATFNEYSCGDAQLIATTHDLLLLDNKKLLRKDQMWLTDRDKDKVELYSLDEFKDNDERSPRGNILSKYLKGYFGALPYPSVIINEIEKEDGNNETTS